MFEISKIFWWLPQTVEVGFTAPRQISQLNRRLPMEVKKNALKLKM